MTTPGERPSTEIRALVDGYSEALEAWHTAEPGDEAGALYPAIDVARQALLTALGSLEEDKQRAELVRDTACDLLGELDTTADYRDIPRAVRDLRDAIRAYDAAMEGLSQ